ncbi:hypothetical protein BDY21DRAFT_116516 [Lineolata rhizophorae]|uniref:DUF6590 domain-containing protein n=1 Tax=Lineolata rhizophorae TaxID=578093 RepID=A0A6A6NQZ2_9PEZI|nr:hypothetical protein BDY21DRAFT_116516 [Lineolata rhizophorae]
MQRGEPGKIDPELLKHGIKSKRKLIGTEGIREKLDPEFEKRYPGRDFFKFGKVLKVLWPEPLGDENAKVTIITDSFGERYATKIRWFVVIREGNDSCSCLPIQTYSRKGVAKPTVKKNDHAIIYTGKKCPVPTRDEKPSQGEKGMRPYAIRVEPRDPSYSMDPLSRINFGKVYTLEHNVKVYDFGKVHKDSRVALKQQFLDVWVDKPSDDDGDEEDDDDDNGRANEYQLPDLPQASGSAYASLHDNRGHYERQRSDTPRISSAGYDSPESGYNQPLAPYGYEKSAALARGNHPYTASRSKSMLYAQHQAAAYQTEGGCAQSIQSNQPPGDEEDEEEEDDYEDTQEGGSHYNVRQ